MTVQQLVGAEALVQAMRRDDPAMPGDMSRAAPRSWQSAARRADAGADRLQRPARPLHVAAAE